MDYPNISVLAGACVGGGSVVFTGVMIQPLQSYFEEIFTDTVSYDEMNSVYYPRVRRKLRLTSMPDGIYNSKPFGHSRIWDEQVTSAGYTPERIDSIFNWKVVRDELHLRSRPSAVIGMSNLGNSNGAKYDLNQNYIKEAEATGNATVYPNQRVTDVERTKEGYRIWIEKLHPKGTVVDNYSITCDYLFLAAGSVGTSELLVKAKAKETIPRLNRHIGKGWGTNGDTLVSRSGNPVDGWLQGSPSASAIHDPDAINPTTFENWFVPGMPISSGIIGTLGIGFDMANRGTFHYDASQDKAMLDWPKFGNLSVVRAARQMNRRISHEGVPPSKPGLFPILASAWGGVTAHPLGGAVIGKATDNYGRVMRQQRLYVMDGAMVPGSSGAVNPSLTIAALAERNIEKIIAEDF